jgi:hypothetical protein
LLTVFWDFPGSILEHYMDRGIAVLSVSYCSRLENELRPAVCTQWRGRLSWGVLVHDRVHLTFQIPSVWPFKNAVRGRQFTDDEVK